MYSYIIIINRTIFSSLLFRHPFLLGQLRGPDFVALFNQLCRCLDRVDSGLGRLLLRINIGGVFKVVLAAVLPLDRFLGIFNLPRPFRLAFNNKLIIK